MMLLLKLFPAILQQNLEVNVVYKTISDFYRALLH